MARQGEQATAERMKRLRAAIGRWRAAVPRSRSMPEPLWNEAAALAGELGVHRVKSALGLNYESLRMRVDQRRRSRQTRNTGTNTPPRFIEVSGAQLLGLPGTGPVVEISGEDGARMTVRLSPGCQLDVAGLVAAYRGSQR